MAAVDMALMVAVCAVCPVDGVAPFDPMGDDEYAHTQAKWPDAVWVRREDLGAWRIDVRPEATTAQRNAAQFTAQSFNPNAAQNQPKRLVAKSLIVDRLHDAGKLEAAYAALNAADLYTQQRWHTRDSIYADDPTAVAMLTAIGADVAAILAPSEGA